jgi:hypothetical protein
MEKGAVVNSPPNNSYTGANILPAWITTELIDETREVWQPNYKRPLTDNEVIEILRNVASLLDAIGECDDVAVSGTSKSF